MRRARDRVVHAPSEHADQATTPGHAWALCGDMAPTHQVDPIAASCPDCLDIAARMGAAAQGLSRGAARRALARSQRRTDRRKNLRAGHDRSARRGGDRR